MAELIPFLPFPKEAEFEDSPQTTFAGPPDAAARAQALDIQRSFLVEAPAGSGKTGLLIQRYLKLLAESSVSEPEQVLAITFTTKATAEMRNRVVEQLEAAALQANGGRETATGFEDETLRLARAVLARDEALGWRLLAEPRRLNIRTIDSVCAEIARALPMLSGSGGRLTPTADAGPLYREAARRTLMRLGGPDAALDTALRDLLLHRDGNLADCETLLMEMLQVREQWGELLPLDRASLDDAFLDANVLPRLERTLEEAVCAELSELCRAFPGPVLEQLTELAAEMAHADGYRGQVSPIAGCMGRDQSPSDAAEDLEHWRELIHLLVKPSKPRDWRKGVGRHVVGFEIEKHHERRLKDLIALLSHDADLMEMLCRIEALPSARYPQNQWTVAKSLFRILSHAMAELQLVFAERNACDFAELSLLARHALAEGAGPEDFAAALGARVEHLLVDEMQDTSAGQYHLIELLTASWDGHSQTVFLVGDPKQSIYLFRQARVERFMSTLRSGRLGDLPLTHLRLTANFRSQGELVERFNHDFSLIFDDSGTGAPAIPYTHADATVDGSSHARAMVWHAHPLSAPQSASDSPAQPQAIGLSAADMRKVQAMRDAREIRRTVQRWLAKPLPAGRRTLADGAPEPWRIAVLVRVRSHLTEIVADFKASGVPYRAVEIDPLSERQEVLDLTALTRALVHPADRVAWLAVLRAPWCGLSLADLHLLTGADDAGLQHRSLERLMGERAHLLGEESRARLLRVLSVLSEASTQRARLTVSQVVERAWRSLGGDAPLGPLELSNAKRFLRLLDELEMPGGRIDLTLLETRLKYLFAEAKHFPLNEAFVDLLTIHRAKGLEWDVVLVPALERRPGFDRARLLTWSELDVSGDEAAPVMLAPIAARGEEVDALTRWLKGIYREREAAERKRLFYVACTRAREELHLFAAPDVSSKGTINPWTESLLRAAWPAAEAHFVDYALVPRTSGRLVTLAPPADRPVPAVDDYLGDLAASDSGVELPPQQQIRPMIQRLPLGFDPAARFVSARARRLPYSEVETARGSLKSPDADEAKLVAGEVPPSDARPSFNRPEGSFAARSFGNVVHVFLELLAARMQQGQTAASLLDGLDQWTPRIKALLRSDGLAVATVDRLTRETSAALEKALRDRDGLWLLGPRAGAKSELSLSAWTADESALVRIDRTFLAGGEPRAAGEEFLWIVDFKTTSHGPAGVEEFLDQQQALYAPQLESYARVLAPTHSKALGQVRLALYYPAIPRLHWWKAGS